VTDGWPCPYARQIPSVGGDTIWSSMYSAYDALSLPMKHFLSILSAEHSYVNSFNLTNVYLSDAKEKLEKAQKELSPVIHPVIRTHPITKRRALFVNATFTTRILGLSNTESDMLLNYLFNLVNKPEYTVRWNWQENDVAFWDNRATQHYAIGDYWPNYRRMERATIIGDKPF
jgi:taurine dioxygenase